MMRPWRRARPLRIDQPDDPPLQGRGITRPRVIQDAVAYLLRQIEAFAIALQLLHQPQRLLVMPEPPPRPFLKRLVKRLLPDVAKRRMAQIMGQGDGFDKIFVQAQIAGNGPRQLSHFQTMRQSCSE